MRWAVTAETVRMKKAPGQTCPELNHNSPGQSWSRGVEKEWVGSGQLRQMDQSLRAVGLRSSPSRDNSEGEVVF